MADEALPPMWLSLSPQARCDYLDRWAASVEWREVISERYSGEDFSVETAELAAAEAAHRAGVPTRKR